MEITNAVIVRTLLGSGFEVTDSIRQPSFIAFRAYRHDEFGAKWEYLFAFSGESRLSIPDIMGLRKIASKDNASLVVIGAAERLEEPPLIVPIDDFIARLGGSVSSFLPLEPC